MPSFVSIDVETANNDAASICQIGMVRFEHGEIVEKYNQFINPDCSFLPMNISIHGINAKKVKNAPRFFEIYDEIEKWLSSSVITSHSFFDRSAIFKSIERDLLIAPNLVWIDATTIIRRTWTQYSKRGYGLSNLSRDFEIEFLHHDACEDARVSGEILCRAIKESGKGIDEWVQILKPKKKAPKEIVANVYGI
ncbi:MAG: 3'-5' exoribonuclease [Caulobacterales bacterium]|nr:3'-5' exoribonuclease [Caulobacterales bacterium]